METPPTFPRPLRPELAPFFCNELRQGFTTEGTLQPGYFGLDLPKQLLVDAWHLNASDIHYEPQSSGARVRLRVDGNVWDIAHLSRDQGKVFINQFKAMAGIDPIVRFTPTHANAKFHMVEGKLDLRISLAPSATGETLAVRLLDAKCFERSILDLGMSMDGLNQVRDWLNQTNGMFLAAGPTGSGKTSTTYSLLHELKSGNRVILSLEDPVEYQMDGLIQIQINALQDMTFPEGAKALLRHDPDVLVLGEIRDSISAQTAVHAAIAGRILLSTIHCRDAVGAVAALRNWGLSSREIADALTVVVAQRLVRKLCESCRTEARPSNLENSWFSAQGLRAPSKVFRPVGCDRCKKLGYRGRTGIFEVWGLDEHNFETILSGGDERMLRRSLARRDHNFLLDDALLKLTAGTTSLDEVRRIAGGLSPLSKRVVRRSA